MISLACSCLCVGQKSEVARWLGELSHDGHIGQARIVHVKEVAIVAKCDVLVANEVQFVRNCNVVTMVLVIVIVVVVLAAMQ